ncbi:tyrosine-type recombinase/integrase [Saccharothrix texasensis]|uniref:Phage integrase family protein n=1 Tax=Saccharothrix texasensis TaxID=103734 RepID=A0A3N1H142_9PSEU|nr:site-specific integrase [Saccharothrix texasensis]ROP36251.1 phage integrase family protein [Saccharothrix texasensis]
MAPQDLWLKKDGTRSARYGRGKRWRVAYEDPNTGEVKTEAFTRKSDAETFEAAIKTDIARGLYIDPEAGKIKVRDFAETWRLNQLHAPLTVQRTETALRLHVLPLLGHLSMVSVRSSTMKAWVKDRATVLAPSTLRVIYLGIVAPMFEQAVLDRVIGVTPCRGIRLPEVEQKDLVVPTLEQVHRVAQALPRRFRPIPLLAAGCGWRGGEIFGAEVDAFNLLHRRATVRQQIVRANGGPAFLAAPKTRQSVRMTPLPDVLVDAIGDHIGRYEPAEVKIVDRTNPRVPLTRTARLMFSTVTGRPLHSSIWADIWPDAVDEAGLPEGTGLHALRHYFATALIANGASVKTVQKLLGHSKPSTTLDVYTAFWPEQKDSTRSLLNDAFDGRKSDEDGEDPVAESPGGS